MRPSPSLCVFAKGRVTASMIFRDRAAAHSRRRETLVAVRTGVAVFADLFLCPLARQGLFHTLLFARLQIIRVALYFLNNVFCLDFTFKPAQRVFQRLAFL